MHTKSSLLPAAGFLLFCSLLANKGFAAAPVVFKGQGKKTVGPFEFVEGKVTFHIKHKTSSQVPYLGIRLNSDANRDGKYSQPGDLPGMLIVNKADKELMNYDHRFTQLHEWSGLASFYVDAPGTWEIKVTTQPEPRHAIEGYVKNDEDRPAVDAKVAIVDDKGTKYPAKVSETGFYRAAVYGGRTYKVTATSQHAKPVEKKVVVPGWIPHTKRADFVMKTHRESDLAVRIDISPPRIIQGQQAKVLVTVYNYGTHAGYANLKLKITNVAQKDAKEVKFAAHATDIKFSAGTADVNYNTIAKPPDADISCRPVKLDPKRGMRLAITLEGVGDGEIECSAQVTGSRPDPRSGNNRAKQKLLVSLGTNTAEKILGKVVTADHQGKIIPLSGVKTILIVDGKERKPVFTNRTGDYEFWQITGRNYAVKVDLVHKNGRTMFFQLKENGKYSSDKSAKSWVQTKEEILPAGIIKKNVRVLGSDKNLVFNGPNARQRQDSCQSCGVHYHLLQVAADFAENKLNFNVELNYIKKVHLFYPHKTRGVAATYSPYPATVQVNRYCSTPDKDSAFISWHEYGHHFYFESYLSGTSRFPKRPFQNDPHGGARNPTSADSISEGFANFYGALVAGSPTKNIYRNFERNHIFHERDRVAALLWDLYDDNNETDKGQRGGVLKDSLSLGIKGIRKFIWSQSSSDVQNVYTLYEQLKNEWIGEKNTHRRSGEISATLSDLDELFVMHDFFSDANNNSKYDPGEKIGYADYYTNKKLRKPFKPASRPRPYSPDPDAQRVAYAIVDEQSRPLAGGIRVQVVYTEDDAKTSSSDSDTNTSGEFLLLVPRDCRHVLVEPVVAGYSGEPWIITADDFWQQVEAADGQPVFDTYTFRLKPTGIEPPDSFEMSSLTESSASFSWRLPDTAKSKRVILVRRADRRPTSIFDSQVVYDGEQSTFTDQELLEGIEYHYALALVGPEGTSELVHLAVEPEAAEPLPEDLFATEVKLNSGKTSPGQDLQGKTPAQRKTLWPLWLLAILVVALVGVTVYQKRNRAGRNNDNEAESG